MRTIVSVAVLAAALLAGGGANAQVTGVTGGSQPIDNHQPSLVLTESVQAFGVFPSQGGGGGTSVIGQIHTFAGTFAPYGGPQANGQLQAIADNDVLFNLVGTT